MNAARHRILELLSSGAITTDEAEELLTALRRPRSSAWDWVVCPLERLQASRAAAVVGGFAALQLVVSVMLTIRFCGALDARVAGADVSWGTALLDLAVSLPLPAFSFWAAARLVGRQGRWVDCLNAVGIARVPLVVIGALAGALRGPLLDAPEGPDVLVVVFAMTTLVMVAWFFTLLVTGFRAISGLRGARLVLTSIGVLFFAVLTSKLILSLAS